MPAHTKLAISLASKLLAAVLIFGKIVSVDGNMLMVATCTQNGVQVDATQAVQSEHSVNLVVGAYVGIVGDWQDGNTFIATAISHGHVCP